jgi:Protein of unknown function (DUF3617)
MMVKAVVTGGLLAGLFQTPWAPPMKSGLWEVTTSTAIQMPGKQAPPPRSMKIRSCATANSWSKSFGQTRQNNECKLTNENRTATHYSFDLSCPNAKGHSEMNFADGSTGHGTTHMEVNAGGSTMTIDTRWDGKYLGADCGSVKPESPQIIQ